MAKYHWTWWFACPREALWTRAILPPALPIPSAIAIRLSVTNLSRAFLAVATDGASVIVIIVAITIMVGAAPMSASLAELEVKLAAEVAEAGIVVRAVDVARVVSLMSGHDVRWHEQPTEEPEGERAG